MLPLIIAAVPSLIKLAENVFTKDSPEAPSRGVEKKDFVMEILDRVFIEIEKAGKMPGILSRNKDLVLSITSGAIDIVVKAVKKKADA